MAEVIEVDDFEVTAIARHMSRILRSALMPYLDVQVIEQDGGARVLNINGRVFKMPRSFETYSPRVIVNAVIKASCENAGRPELIDEFEYPE